VLVSAQCLAGEAGFPPSWHELVAKERQSRKEQAEGGDAKAEQAEAEPKGTPAKDERGGATIEQHVPDRDQPERSQDVGEGEASRTERVMDGGERSWADRALHYSNLAIASFTFVLMGATAIQAAILFGQFRSGKEAAQAAKQSADTAKETLMTTQRAYVFAVHELEVVRAPDGKIEAVDIQPLWKNLGATPAINFKAAVSSFIVEDDWAEADEMAGQKSRDKFEITIGPKLEVLGDPVRFSGQELLAILGRKKFGYVMGKAEYRDVFPDTPARYSKFCIRLEPFSTKSSKPFRLRSVGPFNDGN
jgi:hypothetical protein